MFAQGIQYSCERQLTAVPGTKAPADDLPGFEIEYDRQVLLLAAEPQMGEVLHPGTGMHHAGIGHACLRLGFVSEYCEAFQGIGSGGYLCRRRTGTATLVAGADNDNACQCPDAPGLYLAPA